MIPYGKQNINSDDLEAVIEALNTDFLTTGPLVELFEKKLSEYLNCKFCTVVNNGTSALHLAFLSVGIAPGDTVLVPSVTFAATANAALYCGANVILADVDPKTGSMTADCLRRSLSELGSTKLKAVVLVHYAGNIVDLEEIGYICQQKNIKLICDSCHAFGAKYLNTKIGACDIELINTFSFHPVKTMTTGEGGAISTNSEAVYQRIKSLRSHGIEDRGILEPWHYSISTLGFNYRLTDFQCALGMSQLKRVEAFLEKRTRIAVTYGQIFDKDNELLSKLAWEQNCTPSYHLYPILIDFETAGFKREELFEFARSQNFNLQVHYIPLSRQPLYAQFKKIGGCKGAEKFYSQTVSLPIFPDLEIDDVIRIGKAIKNKIKKG